MQSIEIRIKPDKNNELIANICSVKMDNSDLLLLNENEYRFLNENFTRDEKKIILEIYFETGILGSVENSESDKENEQNSTYQHQLQEQLPEPEPEPKAQSQPQPQQPQQHFDYDLLFGKSPTNTNCSLDHFQNFQENFDNCLQDFSDVDFESEIASCKEEEEKHSEQNYFIQSNDDDFQKQPEQQHFSFDDFCNFEKFQSKKEEEEEKEKIFKHNSLIEKIKQIFNDVGKMEVDEDEEKLENDEDYKGQDQEEEKDKEEEEEEGEEVESEKVEEEKETEQIVQPIKKSLQNRCTNLFKRMFLMYQSPPSSTDENDHSIDYYKSKLQKLLLTANENEQLVQYPLLMYYHTWITCNLQQDYEETIRLCQCIQFPEELYSKMQLLWDRAHENLELQRKKKRELTSVQRFRLRQRYKYPLTIWNGHRVKYGMSIDNKERLIWFYNNITKNPNLKQKKQLAEEINSTVDRVTTFFKNRRTRNGDTKKK